MHGSSSNCVHFGLRNMSCHHRDSILPDEQLLIVRTTYKLVLFDESQSIDCSQVLSVLHGLLSCAKIELEDFLLVRPAEENIGVVLGWMVFED